MKTIIAFFLAAFFAGASLAQDQIQSQPDQSQQAVEGWYQQQSPATGAAGGIFFVNQDTGWVTFGNGLFTTSNGGSLWTLISPPPTYIGYFFDPNNGWGQNDTALIRTFDGGKNWQPVPAPILGQMQVFGMDTLYVFDANGAIFTRSTDTGKHWQTTQLSGNLNTVFFTNSKVGFIGGLVNGWLGSYPPQKGTKGATFWVTTDGGVTWTQQYCPLQENIDQIYAMDKNTLLVSGSTSSNGNMVHSSDGGKSWDTVQTGQYAQNIFFLNKKIGAAVGGNVIQYTIDSGKTWTPQNSTVSTSTFLNSIFFVDSVTGWACGYDPAVILHTTNGGQTFVAQNTSYDSLTIQTFPDPVTTSLLNFQYSLSSPQHVSLTLYDQLGHTVQVLLQNDLETDGVHSIPITLAPTANGVYYYQFVSERYQSSGNITIIR